MTSAAPRTRARVKPYGEAMNAAQLASAIASKGDKKIVIAVIDGRTFYGYYSALGIAKVQAEVESVPTVNSVYVF